MFVGPPLDALDSKVPDFILVCIFILFRLFYFHIPFQKQVTLNPSDTKVALACATVIGYFRHIFTPKWKEYSRDKMTAVWGVLYDIFVVCFLLFISRLVKSYRIFQDIVRSNISVPLWSPIKEFLYALCNVSARDSSEGVQGSISVHNLITKWLNIPAHVDHPTVSFNLFHHYLIIDFLLELYRGFFQFFLGDLYRINH